MRYLFLTLTIIFLWSCSKDLEDNTPLNNAQKVVESQDSNYIVKDFIWKGLNQYYLWQPEVGDLSDTRFGRSLANTNALNTAYTAFLRGFSSPEDLFNALLYLRGRTYGDRFSYISDNYEELEESLQGATLSTGIEYSVASYTSGTLVGIVRYVLPGSDAERQGVRRGDFFLQVDGQSITYTNYQSLLENQRTSITLSFYRLANGQFSFVENKTISQLPLQENPILLHKVLSLSGRRIGYLVYNGFISRYDRQLNDVFATFKNAGLTDFVLDLRYNPGGSVQSAIYLASMLAGTKTQSVFVKQTSNPKMVRRWASDYYFEDNIAGIPINTLNLTKIYILTSRNTASASELIINGLKPYMEVVQIGETTVGKNLASITIRDTQHPENRWAMQPIVFRSENAQGFGDYQTGINPDFRIQENARNLGTLGEADEPLLAVALEQITGRPRTTASVRTPRSAQVETGTFEEIDNSLRQKPYYQRMYVDNPNDK